MANSSIRSLCDAAYPDRIVLKAVKRLVFKYTENIKFFEELIEKVGKRVYDKKNPKII